MEDLNKILGTRIPEDLHLDYKRGVLLAKTTRTSKIRRYISGFANADGGVLIVGIAEADRYPTEITGCDPGDVGGDLEAWAHQALNPLIPYIGFAPVVRVVPHTKGPVLFIAAERAPRLVPCIEDGMAVHYLRIGDGTPKIDPYLYADLVLGRRQQPELAIIGEECRPFQDDHVNLRCQWTASLVNEGLAWVPDWRAGIIGYSMGGYNQLAPTPILKRLEISEPKVNVPGKGEPRISFLDSAKNEYGPLSPMETRQLKFPPMVLPSPMKDRIRTKVGQCIWKGGLYVVPSNGLPVWAQLTADVTAVFQEAIHGGTTRDVSVKATCELLPEMERPCVSLEYLERE